MKPDGHPPPLAAPASVGNKPKPAGPPQRGLLASGAPAGGQDPALVPVPGKQESPPAAAVRPFTPQPAKDAGLPPFRRPQTVAASSIYSMYTQQPAPGKSFQQAVQSALTKAQPRGPHFPSGKLPLLPRLSDGSAGASPPGSLGNSPSDRCFGSESFVSSWLSVWSFF